MHRVSTALTISILLAAVTGCTQAKNSSHRRSNTQGAGSDAGEEERDAEPKDSRSADARPSDADAGPMRSGSGQTAGSGGNSNAGSPARDTRPQNVSGSGGMQARSGAGAAADSGSSEGSSEPDEPPRSMEPLEPNVTAVWAETADQRSLELLSNWSNLPVFGTGQHEQQSSRDRGKTSGETGLFGEIANGNRDFSNFVCKSANADVGPSQIPAFVYDMPVCAESYVRGVVLARFEGSGHVARIWLTANTLYARSGGAGLRSEILRVYVDDNPAVAIQVPLQQVLNGMAGETFTIPFGATSSAYIAWRYPIVFSRKLVVALDHLGSQYYYQIDAVLDAEPQRRVAPRKRLDQRDAAHALLVRPTPVPNEAASLRSEQFSLASSAERSVELTGPATIEELTLRVPADKLASLAGVRVAVRWEGSTALAVDVPLLDLFAASRSVPGKNSLALSAAVEGTTQVLSLRLPMPFRTSAQWTLRNAGDVTADFQLDWVGEAKIPEAEFGHLNVQLNEAAMPPPQLEQTVADAVGRGRYVGLCAELAGREDPALLGGTALDMLQGDFRAMADGRVAIDGTGTEDYADSAFYFQDSPKGSPFAQNWGRVEDASKMPPGQVSFCRWQVLGSEIDFQRSFHALHEVSQKDPAIVQRHRTIAFLYLP